MKIVNCILCLAVFVFCFSGSAFAINRVYSFDSSYGIVADDINWLCAYKHNGNTWLGVSNHEKLISGQSKHLPIFFDFFCRPVTYRGSFNIDISDKNIFQFLSNYALMSGTIFSNLTIRDSQEDNCFVLHASYFDSTSIGKIAFYMSKDRAKNFPNPHYCMFIKMPGELLDDQAIEHLFQETFNLITPLIIK